MQLFDYQSELMEDLFAKILDGYSRPACISPTGSGKTVMFSFLASKAIRKGKRVLILTHREELLKQSSKTLTAFAVNAGIIKAGYTPNNFADVQVASVATLVKRMLKLKHRFDVIIIDECHHATAGTYKKIIEYYNPRVVVGFTATPERADGSGLNDVFDCMCLGPSIRDLVNIGRLTRPICYDPYGFKPEFYKLKPHLGDFKQSDVSPLMDTKTITGDAVSHYIELGREMPGVAFCVSVAHAENVAAAFNNAGISAAAVSGAMKQKERNKILNGLGDGSVKIVCSCDLISEGFDIPAIGVTILLRPTMSLGLYIQQIGRALRVMPGKKNAIVLDHAGNIARHGPILQNFQWDLNARDKKSKSKGIEEIEPKTRQCSECFAIYEPRPKCPECGAGSTPQPRIIKTISGRLIQVPDDIDTMLVGDIPHNYEGTPSQWAAEKIKKERAIREKERLKAEAKQKKERLKAEAKKTRREKQAARTLPDLLELAKQKGYKPAWAYKIFNLRKQKQISK